MSLRDLPDTVILRGTFGDVWLAARSEIVHFVRYPGRLTFVETVDGRIGEVVFAT